MLSMSDDFFAAIRSSHKIAQRVDAVRNGLIVAEDLPLASGSVTVDATSATRRQLTATFQDSALWPLLSQVGTELRVQRGVEFGDGRVEMAPVGVFWVADPASPYGSGQVQTSAPDRWTVVSRARFLKPQQWNPVWESVSEAIQALMLGPWLDRKKTNPLVEVPDFLNLMPGVGAPKKSTVWARDRAAAITDLATSIGAEAYFDANGNGVLRPIPVQGNSVWEANAGESGVLTAATRSRATEASYNTVVVNGLNDSGATTVTGIAQVTDPADPLWIGGDFGVVPYFYSSTLITTQAQALATAHTLLLSAAAIRSQVSATCIPNPALEEGDTILFEPDSTSELHVLQGFTIPLGVDTPTQDLTLKSSQPDLPAETA